VYLVKYNFKRSGIVSLLYEGGEAMTSFEILVIVIMLMSLIVTILLHYQK